MIQLVSQLRVEQSACNSLGHGGTKVLQKHDEGNSHRDHVRAGLEVELDGEGRLLQAEPVAEALDNLEADPVAGGGVEGCELCEEDAGGEGEDRGHEEPGVVVFDFGGWTLGWLASGHEGDNHD